jgi:hypothetical protein
MGTYTVAVGLMSAIEQGVVSVWHSPILIMILVLFGDWFEVWGSWGEKNMKNSTKKKSDGFLLLARRYTPLQKCKRYLIWQSQIK